MKKVFVKKITLILTSFFIFTGFAQAQEELDICDRTKAVKDEILRQLNKTSCENIALEYN